MYTLREEFDAIVNTLARNYYEAYCTHANWKNYQGLPCPQWEDLTEAIRSHWVAVADESIKLIMGFQYKLLSTLV